MSVQTQVISLLNAIGAGTVISFVLIVMAAIFVIRYLMDR